MHNHRLTLLDFNLYQISLKSQFNLSFGYFLIQVFPFSLYFKILDLILIILTILTILIILIILMNHNIPVVPIILFFLNDFLSLFFDHLL